MCAYAAVGAPLTTSCCVFLSPLFEQNLKRNFTSGELNVHLNGSNSQVSSLSNCPARFVRLNVSLM